MHRDRFAQCTVRNWGQHAVAIIAAFFMFLNGAIFSYVTIFIHCIKANMPAPKQIYLSYKI